MSDYYGPVVPGKFELPNNNINLFGRTAMEQGAYLARALAVQLQNDYSFDEAVDHVNNEIMTGDKGSTYTYDLGVPHSVNQENFVEYAKEKAIDNLVSDAGITDPLEKYYYKTDLERQYETGVAGNTSNLTSNVNFDFDSLANAILQNNKAAAEQAKIARDFSQASAREAMQFEADQAKLNRDWQTSANKLAMDFSSKEAQISRDWQERMSNTAYQRAVSDLRAAGLNPILAYSQGGAATTSGASASGVTSAGSTASGHASSAAAASTDMTSYANVLTTLLSNAKDLSIAKLNSVFKGIDSFTRLVDAISPG